ncbi:MAG: cation diffusion facilitator family transporter [Bacilli bacterium]
MVRSKVKEGSDKMDKTTKYMMISMVSNLFLSVLKIVFGFISNMKSLIADGIHSFSDLITDMVAIFGNRLSKKPADNGHPRGHGKIEYITSLIISCFILVLGLSILKNSFSKTDTIPNPYLIIVVIITIVTKYFLSYILIRKGKEINNMILISSGKESYTDVYSSILVLVVIILSQFYDKINVLKYSDMIGSILISVLILSMGIKLLFQNLSLLIGESEQDSTKIERVKEIINNRNEKFILEECTLFKLGSYYEVVLKILVDGSTSVKEGHELMDEIEYDLLNSDMNIKYAMIHIEPIEDDK